MIIAIAGKIGSGKSTLSAIIESAGHKVIHTDDLVHDYYKTEAGVLFVQKMFPDAIIEEKIDRKLLAQCLLKDTAKRMLLEKFVAKKLLYPLIQNAKNEQKVLYVDGVLPNYFAWFDQVIYVDRNVKARKKDVIKARGISEDVFENINHLQKFYPELLR